MLSVGIYTDRVRNAVLSSGLVVTYGQETAKFVCGSPKGLHSHQFLDMPLNTNRPDVVQTERISPE